MSSPENETERASSERRRLPPGRPVALPNLPDSPHYSMKDLVAATGISDRNIRYYISLNLLSPAQGSGPAAFYTKDHLLRLNLIDELKATQNLSNEQIGKRLATMTTADLEAHFKISTRAVEGRWRRVLFHPDLELHIHEQETPDLAFESAVDEIIKYARLIMGQLEVK